jgi:hypothetical protein
MTVNVRQESQPSTGRFSASQKFWLFGVGVPVMLVIVLLALAVFLPKPLNPTEKKLLGRWEVVAPSKASGKIVDYQPGYKDVGGTRFITWCPDEGHVCVSWFEYGDVPAVWARFWAKLGYSTSVAEILSLDENELRIKYARDTSTIVFRRIEATNSNVQDSE